MDVVEAEYNNYILVHNTVRSVALDATDKREARTVRREA